MAQEQAGQNQKAVTTFTRAIATRALSRADEARATFNRGVALDTLGRTAEAVADYSKALRLDSKLSAALNNRGNAYRRLGRLEAAKRDYLAALRCAGEIIAVPALGYEAEGWRKLALPAVIFRPTRPLTGAGFTIV